MPAKIRHIYLQEKQELIKKLYFEKKRPRDISKITKIPETTLKRILEDLGLKLHGRTIPNKITGNCIYKGYKYTSLNGVQGFEHRQVWELNHGKIPEGKIIHHKNGIKHDNRLENLELLSVEEHVFEHHFKHEVNTLEILSLHEVGLTNNQIAAMVGLSGGGSTHARLNNLNHIEREV